MSENARERILAAAKSAAQLHGYGGINFRSIAEEVGIKNASIYYHFQSKADLVQPLPNGIGRKRWRRSVTSGFPTLTRSGACSSTHRFSVSP